MLVLVPEPVWKTSSGKWSSNAPKDISDATSWMAAATSFGMTRRRPLTVAATPLIEPRAWISSAGDPLAGDREVLDGPLRLRTPPRRDRDPHLAHGVVLDAHLPLAVVGGGRRSGCGGHGRHATAGPGPRDTVTACRSSNTRTSSPSVADDTPYRLLTTDGVSTFETAEGRFVQVEPEALTLLTREAMRDIAHLLRPGHLQQLRNILDDPEASPNDRFVALDLLKNASIAAGGVLPMCQDTGTAIVKGKKGQRVLTGGGDEEAIARGHLRHLPRRPTCATRRWRRSTMWDEVNTGTNLPAEIEIAAVDGDAYKFLFMAKGGGSANKSYLFQETKALLNPKPAARASSTTRSARSGTAACPPYHLAIVIGGTSAEFALETAKLASARYLDTLPEVAATSSGTGFRDLELEAEVLELTQRTASARSSAASTSATTCASSACPATAPAARSPSPCRARPTARRSARSPPTASSSSSSRPIRPTTCPRRPTTDLGGEVGAASTSTGRWARSAPSCSRYPVKTRLLADRADGRGPRHRPRQDQGAPRRRAGLPQYLRDHCVYYAGPAKTPAGLRLRLVRPDHRRAHGQLRRPVPGRTAAAS